MKRLTTDRLVIKEVSLSDLTFIHALHSHPDVDEFNTLGIPKFVEETRAILNEVIADQQKIKRSHIEWVIFLQEDDEEIPVGNCGLFVHPERFKKGEIYYNIFPDYWQQGYAFEAVQRIVSFCFDDMNFHRIEAGVAIGNLKSIRLLEKLGFTREGRHRNILPIRGEWKDNFTYSMLEDERPDQL